MMDIELLATAGLGFLVLYGLATGLRVRLQETRADRQGPAGPGGRPLGPAVPGQYGRK